MLHLPSVTLLAIDCVTPGKTCMAIHFSTRWVKFGRMVLLTDKRRHQMIEPRIDGLEIIHHEQSDRKVAPYPGHPPIAIDYERDLMMLSKDYCEEDGHVLQIEWDSAILNHRAWWEGWLDYSFIGAPWISHHDIGWPPCTEANNVGNFGFSLKSKRFCELMAEAYQNALTDPDLLRQAHGGSDRFICRTMRPYFESQGIVFAPEEEAARFSCENRIYCSEFAIHGRSTIQMNGWRGPFFEERYPTK